VFSMGKVAIPKVHAGGFHGVSLRFGGAKMFFHGVSLRFGGAKMFFHGVSLRFRGAKLNFPGGFSQVWRCFTFSCRRLSMGFLSRSGGFWRCCRWISMGFLSRSGGEISFMSAVFHGGFLTFAIRLQQFQAGKSQESANSHGVFLTGTRFQEISPKKRLPNSSTFAPVTGSRCRFYPLRKISFCSEKCCDRRVSLRRLTF